MAHPNSSSQGLARRLTEGIAWNTVATVFTQGSIFATNIIIANILGRDVFGEYAMLYSTVLTVSVIAQVATGITATKYVAEFRAVDKHRTGRILGLCSGVTVLTGCVAAFLVIALAPVITGNVLKAPHITHALIIGSGYVVFSVINGYQAGALAGLERYRLLALVSSIHAVSHVVLCALGAWWWGLEGVLAGLAISAVTRWILSYWVLRRESEREGITLSYRGAWQESTILGRFMLPAAVSGLSTMPAVWAANALLVRQPAGYADMGLFAAALSLKNLVLFVPGIVNVVGMSVLNSKKAEEKDKHYRQVFWVNLAVTAVALLLGVIGIGALGEWLLRLFGQSFTEGYWVLLILLLAVTFEGLSLGLYQIIQAQEKMWISLFAVALPRDLLLVGLAYFLVPIYGALGLAIAHWVSWTVAFSVILCTVYMIGLGSAPYRERIA